MKWLNRAIFQSPAEESAMLQSWGWKSFPHITHYQLGELELNIAWKLYWYLDNCLQVPPKIISYKELLHLDQMFVRCIHRWGCTCSVCGLRFFFYGALCRCNEYSIVYDWNICSLFSPTDTYYTHTHTHNFDRKMYGTTGPLNIWNWRLRQHSPVSPRVVETGKTHSVIEDG